jgi:hypothetical protein
MRHYEKHGGGGKNTRSSAGRETRRRARKRFMNRRRLFKDVLPSYTYMYMYCSWL